MSAYIVPPANQMLKRIAYDAERSLHDGNYQAAVDLLDWLPSKQRDLFLSGLTDAQREALEPFMV